MNGALLEARRQAFGMLRPPSRRSVSQWADECRMLTSATASEAGRWRTDRAPFQREIMDAFTQAGIWQIVIIASSQVGKTEMELNMRGRVVDEDRGGAGCVQRYDPRTGRALAERIALLERNVSCCCFGGADMRTLYITTASAEGEGGGLYACRVPVSGPAPFGWQGELPRSAD